MAEAATLYTIRVCLFLFPLPAGSSRSGRTASSDSSLGDVPLINLPVGTSGMSPGETSASTTPDPVVVSHSFPPIPGKDQGGGSLWK